MCSIRLYYELRQGPIQSRFRTGYRVGSVSSDPHLRITRLEWNCGESQLRPTILSGATAQAQFEWRECNT